MTTSFQKSAPFSKKQNNNKKTTQMFQEGIYISENKLALGGLKLFVSILTWTPYCGTILF